ncbi:hypothetical protein Tco_0755334 [Tanacetum coccineum]
MSSECNNITLAIQNDKSEIVYVMCKKCLVTANHDVCVLNYVNDMNFCADNQSANVSIHENQKKHKANAKKLKELGSKESIASSRPSKPRTCLSRLIPTGRILIPTGRIFSMCGKLTASSNTENKSKKSMRDNASISNPSEPSSKGFSNSISLLGSQNRIDLPRNTPLDRVKVLGMIEKRSKVRMGRMPTKTELALEQSQQGVGYEVLYVFLRMPQSNFGKLKPIEQNRIFEANVYHKWIARDVPKETLIAYYCLLFDRRTMAYKIIQMLMILGASILSEKLARPIEFFISVMTHKKEPTDSCEQDEP